MCGRFNVAQSPGLQALLDALGNGLRLPESRVNIAPTEVVSVLRDNGSGVAMENARWWLTPSWSDGPSQKYAMFNARSEGLDKSRAFRVPFRRQRGVLPMSSFIEWRGTGRSKMPWLIESDRGGLLAAALWDTWTDEEAASGRETLLSCTIVTTAAAKPFAPWHSRMPVLLTEEEAHRWLDNTSPVSLGDPLLQPRLKFPLTLRPLAKAVGNAREKSLRVLEPVGADVRLEAEALL